MSTTAVDQRPSPAVAVGRSVGRLRTFAFELAVVLIGYQAYRFVRRVTEGNRGRAFDHSNLLLRFEDRLGINIEQGIQSVVLDSRTFVDLVNRLYVWTFWPVVIGVLVALYVLNRDHYRHYRNALFISGAIGLFVFWIFPVAPPRMLDGFVDTVEVFAGSTEMARPGKFTNQYAAMPSFHCGWLVLAGMAVKPIVPWARVGWLVLLPGALMTFTVMATANHYLVDAIVGIGLALGALAVSYRVRPSGRRDDVTGARPTPTLTAP